MNLACFIWNYAQPSNPAKYLLLRAREAGALGLPSAERQIPARRSSHPAPGGMSRCRGCWRGCAHLPHPPSGEQPCPWVPTFPGLQPEGSLQTLTLSDASQLRGVFLCLSTGFLHGSASRGGWMEAFTGEDGREESGFGRGLMRQLQE